jgi:DNA-binding Lrp family transcriptional regulator
MSTVAVERAAMPSEERKQVEAAILQVLQKEGERPLVQVVDEIHMSKVSEAAIKAAIWKLYASGLLELTNDWKLRLGANF